MINNDVTAVICTKNAETNLEACLKNLKQLELDRIIAIDADSEDKTQEILKNYNIEIYRDSYRTLGGARSIAVQNTNTKYIFFLGPDNFIDKLSLQLLKTDMIKNKWIGIAPLQKILEPKGYILNCLNIYKSVKITTGVKQVIGTPQLYLSEILKKNNYNSKMHYSDDTELGERLNKLNLKIGVGNIKSYEVGENKIKDIYKRWNFYGRSDIDFYNFKRNDWSFKRKISSIFSPIRKDFINIIISKKIHFIKKIYILPFLLLIVIARYCGWFKL